MPANHHIDKVNKVIITKWQGEPSDKDLFDVFKRYLNEVNSNPELDDYNELVDFTNIKGNKLTINTLIELGRYAAKFDKPGEKKLVIVVKTPLAYGLARVYAAYRNQNHQSHKEIQIFKDNDEALVWLRSQKSIYQEDELFFLKKTPPESDDKT